mmetsp:Transcript_27742/g.65872  ORF Transcript_27742/g.65872 Transcript_27742/m.65872 type:complete len:223 (+) Transcript_27742:3471-4139(+)
MLDDERQAHGRRGVAGRRKQSSLGRFADLRVVLHLGKAVLGHLGLLVGDHPLVDDQICQAELAQGHVVANGADGPRVQEIRELDPPQDGVGGADVHHPPSLQAAQRAGGLPKSVTASSVQLQLVLGEGSTHGRGSHLSVANGHGGGVGLDGRTPRHRHREAAGALLPGLGESSTILAPDQGISITETKRVDHGSTAALDRSLGTRRQLDASLVPNTHQNQVR